MATQSQQASPDDIPCLKSPDIVDKASKASKTLQYDLCAGWVHITCTDTTYADLQSMKGGSLCLCETCQDKFPTMPKKIAALAEENNTLKSQLKERFYLPKSVPNMKK